MKRGPKQEKGRHKRPKPASASPHQRAADTSAGPARKPRPSKPGFELRRIALKTLSRVLDDGDLLDPQMEEAAWKALSPADRALLRAIVSTTLRRLGEIDHLLALLMDRPLGPKGQMAKHILRLGVTQLLYLDVADHAAVATAVDLADSNHKTRPYKALINAILRRLTREREQFAEPPSDAGRLNTPNWLFKSWSAAYGESKALQIANAHQLLAPLDLSAHADQHVVAQDVGGSCLSNGSVRLNHRGQITDLPGFAEGRWWVQDAAARLPAMLLGQVAGAMVADLCAAPGGKTAQLAAAGAHVTAVDSSAHRLKRLHENMIRLNFAEHVQTVEADLHTWEPDTLFDAILLDAPCSATGTLRRHPDAAWTKRKSDLKALIDLQAALLERALKWLKPGGRLVYCTCSLQPEEGADQIEALLSRNADFVRLPITADDIGGLESAVTDTGDLRTLPYMSFSVVNRYGETNSDQDNGSAFPSGMDGFFASRLMRK